MTKRLTISIPDELALDLEPHKDAITISNVCASALRAAVDERKAMQNLPALAKAAVRMRGQRKQAQDQPRRDAYAKGWNWIADTASYEDVQDWLHIKGNPEAADKYDLSWQGEFLSADMLWNSLEGGGGSASDFAILGALFEALSQAECLPPNRVMDEDLEDWGTEYSHLWDKYATVHEAFLAGVADAWKQIQPTVEAD